MRKKNKKNVFFVNIYGYSIDILLNSDTSYPALDHRGALPTRENTGNSLLSQRILMNLYLLNR